MPYFSDVSLGFQLFFSGTKHNFKGQMLYEEGTICATCLGIDSSVFCHIFIFFRVMHIESMSDRKFALYRQIVFAESQI